MFSDDDRIKKKYQKFFNKYKMYGKENMPKKIYKYSPYLDLMDDHSVYKNFKKHSNTNTIKNNINDESMEIFYYQPGGSKLLSSKDQMKPSSW